VAAVLVIGGTPLAAGALASEPAPTSGVAALDDLASASELAERTSVPDSGTAPDAPRPAGSDPAPAEPTVDPVVFVLTATYAWDERGPRVQLLQEVIGVEPDGRYGALTRQAHVAALGFAGLPTDNVPVPVLPPGPSAEQWAALRDCESGGDYSITNPSGRDRGAYQFDRPTWDSVAGRHAPHLVGVDPAAASPADQDAMAFALYSERGAGPWPQCGRYLS